MHRPPRPAIKSSQLFPLHPLRRLFTPDALQLAHDTPPQDVILKTIRQNALPSHINSSVSQPINAEYLDVSQKQEDKKPASTQTRFKIRNHTHNHRVKENTIPIKSSRMVPTSSKVLHNSYSTLEGEIKRHSTLYFSPYPSDLALNEIGNKITYHKLACTPPDQCQTPRPALLISQSMFPSSFNDESTHKKILSICLAFKAKNPDLAIIIQLPNDRQLQNVSKAWQRLKVPVDYIVWPKLKHSERVAVLDATQLAKQCGINRFLVIHDKSDFCRSIYYTCQRDENQQPIVNTHHKYCYIQVSSSYLLSMLGSQVTIAGDKITSEAQELQDISNHITGSQQIRQKIELFKFRRCLKARRISRRNSQEKISREFSAGSMHNLHEKSEEFKRKMIQYVKILQEEKKVKKESEQEQEEASRRQEQIRKQSLEMWPPKPDSARSSRVRGPLRFVEQKSENSLSKTAYQIVYELLKINSGVHKQISKYQEETRGIQLERLGPRATIGMHESDNFNA